MASYSDDFNRAALGSDWVNVAPGGSWSIVSNRLRCGAATTPTTLNSVLQYTSALETEEHSAQIDFTSTNDSFFWLGPAINITDGVDTAYLGLIRQASNLSRIYEVIDGADTPLVSGSDGHAPPATIKLQRSGSTLTLFDGATSILEYEVVGTPLSGLYAGAHARSNISNTAFSEGDNWSAEDLAAGGTTVELSAQETGTDSFTGAFNALVSAVLSAQEAGSDTASFSLTTATSIVLAAQETGLDTFNATFTALVTASMAAQEAGNDTFTALASVLAQASLAAQEAGVDTAAVFLTLADSVALSLAAQEAGNDTLSAELAAAVSLQVAAQEQGDDTASVVMLAPVSLSMSIQESGLDSADIRLRLARSVRATFINGVQL